MFVTIIECDHAAEMPARILHIASHKNSAVKHAADILHKRTTQIGILKLLVTLNLDSC